MKHLILLLFIICSGCSSNKDFSPIVKNRAIDSLLIYHTNKIPKNWEFKDAILDTLPGISLYRAYDSILNYKESKTITVALIDMTVEINHSGLKNNIWINDKEKINNIDDDSNGYVDDVNGWNFLGNSNGQNNEFVNYEYTRIIRKFNSKFKNSTNIYKSRLDSIEYSIYQKSLKKHNTRLKFAKEDLEYIKMVNKSKNDSENLIKHYIKNEFSLKKLDSLKNIYKNDTTLQKAILIKSNFIKYGYSSEFVNSYKLKAKARLEKLLNLEYNDRRIQKDNPADLNDYGYGTYKFNKNTTLLDHGTLMAGIISKVGLKNEIKIMPLTISAYGDEHDKDIALAIRYAVDNGAKVINMSFAKEFSLHLDWVLKAIQYANKNNVLIVSAAANDKHNLDLSENSKFPNDHNFVSDIEVSNNFLSVGSSSYKYKNYLKSSFSNYGKKEVDVFAPGEKIYTTFPNNKFDISYGGTSSASALTSGVAALLYAYYPNLSVSQIKEIIMYSGLEFDVMVKTPTKEDKKKMTSFNKLSKSGKIVNIYNAIVTAEKK